MSGRLGPVRRTRLGSWRYSHVRTRSRKRSTSLQDSRGMRGHDAQRGSCWHSAQEHQLPDLQRVMETETMMAAATRGVQSASATARIDPARSYAEGAAAKGLRSHLCLRFHSSSTYCRQHDRIMSVSWEAPQVPPCMSQQTVFPVECSAWIEPNSHRARRCGCTECTADDRAARSLKQQPLCCRRSTEQGTGCPAVPR